MIIFNIILDYFRSHPKQVYEHFKMGIGNLLERRVMMVRGTWLKNRGMKKFSFQEGQGPWYRGVEKTKGRREREKERELELFTNFFIIKFNLVFVI